MPDIRTVELTRAIVDKHKAKVRYLSHVRINNKTKGFAAFVGNDLVGVVNTEEKNARSIWIQALEVSKEYQKQGIGKTLLDMAMKKLHANFLSVRKTNKVAIEMYKKKGFHIADESGVMYIMTTLPSSEDFEEAGESVPELSLEEARSVMRGLSKQITSDYTGVSTYEEAPNIAYVEPQVDIYCEMGSDGVEHFCVGNTQYIPMLESGEEAFMEDAVGKTRILRDCVEKRIFTTLDDPQKNRAYRKIINDFIERNIEKLTTAGPVYLIVFGDDDQAMYFNLFGIQKQEVVDAMVKLTTMAEKKSDFKYLRNNPIYVVLYYCIRYFTMKNDQKGLNMTLSIYALAVYWSIFTKYFPKGVIEPVMQYTIDNLTDKFLIKKSKHIFGTLVESITRSYNFHKPRIRVGNDDDAVSWIQRIRNDQNSLIKKVATEYMKNWKAGNAVTTRNDGYDSDAPILDSNENATSMIQNHVSKVTLPIIANGVDILFAEAAAKMAQISVSDCRQYLVKIMVQKNLETLERFVESILFLFIYEEQHSLREIRSEYFMAWAQSLFKKTNSKNQNINRINAILEQWAEESGIYERFRREGSRINYKKAIFFYVIMSIQKYS